MDENQGLKPGAFLRHNTYRIEKVLGQGGFGITYLTMDLNLDRHVAIKEFFPKDYCDRDDSTSHVTLGTQSSKEFVSRLKAKFLKEARNIAKFDNPSIIRIHSAFEENNTAYYVMDYIEGKTLSEIVKTSGPISENRALYYIKKVGSALEYVHNRNMTHLDVKPANVIIRDNDEEPILIDFGLAKQYDAKGNQTSTTPIGISHGFAPMEQYNDGGVKEFSPQTDLYALGATLYYILSGIVPPQATKLIEDELIFPQIIPPALIGPITKAMSPRRKNRHTSVSQFIAELEGIPSDNNKENKVSHADEVDVIPHNTTGSIKKVNSSVSDDTIIERESKGRKKIILVSVAISVLIIMGVLFFIKNGSDASKEDQIVSLVTQGDSILNFQLGLIEKGEDLSIDNIQELEKVKKIYGEVNNHASDDFLKSTQLQNRINLVNRLINEIDQYEQSVELVEKAKITDMEEEYIEFSKIADGHRNKINQLIQYLK